ncbi:MAG: FecR domain-containing protein [Anaerolineales bacterium]|nr:FecR domain-containing protein [Anaerolineales bacterium]
MFSKRVLAFLLLVLLLASCSGVPPAATPLPITALLNEVEGLVGFRNPSQTEFYVATEGTGLQIGAEIQTGSDGRARMDLASGTLIRVGPNSLFQFQANEPADDGLLTRLVLSAGQLWVSLRGGALEIETPSGVASVRGSHMAVWVDPVTQDVWVDCLEGWCQAENPSGVMDMITGEGCLLNAWDPAANVSPPPPALRYLTPEDILEFLANNPEMQEQMNAILATASALPPLTPEPTSTPLGSCFELTTPANGAELPASGPVTFTWSEQPGAYKYILTIVKPDGAQIALISWTNSYQKDMARLPEGGTYLWQVTAYDNSLRPICTAGPFTFTKPESSAPTQPNPTAGPCTMILQAPANGAELPASGPVTFTWSEYPGAYKYILTIVKPDGREISEIVWTNSYQKDMSQLPPAGTYQWQVTAYDANIQPLCTAGPFTFTKPESNPSDPPTAAPGSCVTLLTPANGASLSEIGPVEFTWSAYPGAYKYIITFFPPNTPQVTFLAWTPSHLRYMESFPDGGTYSWTITVKDQQLRDICTTEPFTFTKPQSTLPIQPPAATSDPGTGGAAFWNQQGPGGLQTSCNSLYFSVSTSLSGMIKVIYSKTNSSPDGNSDPHHIIGNGPGTGAGSFDFSGYSGQTIYYRFAVISGGTYTHDGPVFSFTCP